MQEAFKAEKWAFVSDYVRLYALNKFGGFYFDTDLEIKRNLDEFLKLDFCTCYEKLGNKSNPVMTAFLAAEKGNSIIKDLMIEYDGRTFITAKGYDLTTNVHHVKKYFEKNYSLHAPYNIHEKKEIRKGEIIFPYFYFCIDEGENTYAVHKLSGSWLNGYEKRLKLRLGRYFLVVYKRQKNNSTNEIELKGKEKIIAKIKITKRKYLAIVSDLEY